MSQLLTFRVCDTRKCVSIRTVSDCIMEDNPDTFFVRLGTTPGLNRRINVSTERSVVNIRDDEGMQLCYVAKWRWWKYTCVGELDRSLTHYPSSQGFASKCSVFVYVCVGLFI